MVETKPGNREGALQRALTFSLSRRAWWNLYPLSFLKKPWMTLIRNLMSGDWRKHSPIEAQNLQCKNQWEGSMRLTWELVRNFFLGTFHLSWHIARCKDSQSICPNIFHPTPPPHRWLRLLSLAWCLFCDCLLVLDCDCFTFLYIDTLIN